MHYGAYRKQTSALNDCCVMFLSSLSGNETVMNKNEAADVQLAQPENVKKTNKSCIREMESITLPEFENIPQ